MGSMREAGGGFGSCGSCKRLVPSRLHESHGSKFSFVSRIEFVRSKFSNFSAHVSGVTVDNYISLDRMLACVGMYIICLALGLGASKSSALLQILDEHALAPAAMLQLYA